MPACPACDATLPSARKACPDCGTHTTFSFDRARGSVAQATRSADAARKEIGVLRAEGVEPVVAERLLDKADAEIRQERAPQANAFAQAARRAARIAKAVARAREDLASAEEAVRAAKQAGADTAAAERALEQAGEKLAARNATGAQAWIRKVSTLTAEGQRVKSAEVYLRSADRAIRHAKERGADVTEAKQELERARDALRGHAFDAAREGAVKARDSAERARKHARYSKFVASAERTIEAAKKTGADLSEARRLAREAKAALNDGRFADAQSRSAQAKEAVAEAKRYRSAEMLIQRAQRAARKEERRGVDVTGPALMLVEATQALEQREYRRARDIVRETREAIREAILVRRLRGALGILATDIEELQTIGAETAEPRALHAEATAALESRDFDRCRRVSEVCRRAADDAREARRQDIVISTIQRIVEAAAGTGRVRADEVRGLIQDVESMLASGEAVDVEALVGARLQVVDAEKLKEAAARLGHVRAMLAELRSAQIDVMGAPELIESASRAIDGGRIDEAERHIGELEDVAGTLLTTMKESARESVDRARQAADKARGEGIPIPDAVRMLRSAEAALEEGRPYEALEFGRIAQMRAERALQQHREEVARRNVEALKATEERVRLARERIDSLSTRIEYLTGFGVDVEPARDSLGNAERALEQKRVEELETHLSAAERIVEGMHGALRRNAQESLRRLGRTLEEARSDGLVTEEMESVFAQAQKAMDENNPREALAAIAALEESLERARRERAEAQRRKEMEQERRAADRVTRVRRMVDELRKANIDIQGADETILQAEMAVQSRDFEKVDTLVGDLETTAREMRAELLAATRFIVTKAREAVDAAERQGLDVSNQRMLLENAEQFLDRGKLDEAVEAANTAKQRADAAARLKGEEDARQERMRLETARQKIERLKATLDDLHRADITVDGAEEAIRRAEVALAEKEYDEVHAILQETESLAATLQEGLKTAAEQLLGRSRESVEDARKRGLNIRRADMVLVNATEAIRQGRYVEAIEYHKVIDDIVSDAERMRAFRELEGEVQVLRSEVAAIAALGGDTLVSERLLTKAQEEVAIGRFDRVAEYTREARETLALTRRHILEGKLDRARIAIGRAEMLGANPVEAKALIPEIEKAIELGNTDAVELLVRRVEEKAAQSARAYTEAKAEEDFLAVEELERQVSQTGMDVSEARRFMEEAKKLKDAGEFESMTQAVAEARRILEEGSHDRVVAAYRDKLDRLASMIETARRIGANVDEAERILAQAEEALAADDLANADTLVKRAEMSTGHQIQAFIRNKYPKLVLNLPTAGLQAGAWNRYILEIANRGTSPARNVDLEVKGDVEVRGLERIPEIAVEEAKTLEIGVRPRKEGDVPVRFQMSYDRYFDENRYDAADSQNLKVESAGTYLVEDVFLIHTDGRLVAHESRQFRQRIDEDIFSGMLTVVQDFIRDAFRQRSQTGLKRLDFGQSKILIERSRHCFLACVVLGQEPALLPLYMAEVMREIESKYGQVLDGWSGMLAELPGVDEVIRKLVLVSTVSTAERGALADSSVAAVQDLLEAAREEGAETSEVEEILAQAESSLETDMDLALQLVGRAKSQVLESKRAFHERMREILQDSERRVERLRELGVDTAPMELLLKEAHTAFVEARYAKVKEISDHIRAALQRVQLESASKEIEEKLGDLIREIEAARAEGIEVSRVEAFLVRIEEAIRNRQFRAVEDLLRQAHETLAEERKKALMKKAGAEIERLTGLLVEAKEFGADATEAEMLLLRAREAQADGRAEDAGALVRQAGVAAHRRISQHLEGKVPKLFISLPPGGFQSDAWNRLTLEIANKGNWTAKDVEVKIAGDMDVRGLRKIPRIDPNSKEKLELGVRPKREGPLPVDVELRYRRPLDEKAYDIADTREVRVESKGTYHVDDVFLVHRDGRLITHESRRYREGIDEDIFSGMLTVVLNFVKDSFRDRADAGLKRLEFGEDAILFERSPNAYLAATVHGGEPIVLPIYMVDALLEIEDRFGDRLKGWTGFLSELEGVVEIVRRLLYVTEAPEGYLGPLEGSPIAEALRLVGQAEEEGASFVQEARGVIEGSDFLEASEFVRKAMKSYAAGREELHTQLRDAIMTHGAAAGLRFTDEQLKDYIDVVRRVVEAVLTAREKAGLDRVWPVKRLAVKVDTQDSLDAVTSFRKIIVNQSLAKEFDIVPPGETWRGLKLDLQLDSEAIAKSYRLWARKIELLLRSQDAWKIKHGIDKGEYSVGVEGQKARIDPSMVWFIETVPENVIEEAFDGGTVYLDTEVTEDILGEGYARELVNIILDARKDLKLGREVWIETRIRGSETLNKLLKKWRDFISHETNSQSVRFVRDDLKEGYVLECNLGSESFTVSVRPAEGVVVKA